MKILRFQYLFLLLLLCKGVNLNAQEMWGVANSNYAGTMGHELNPASIVAAPFRWEIHFISADASVMNNYMYLARNSQAIRLGVKGESVNEERFLDRYTTNDKKAFGSLYIKLPALMYSTHKWGLGFHVSTKVGLSATGVPYHLAKFMKEGFDYSPQHQINYTGGNTALAAMNYHEAGLTGGMLLMDDKTSFVTGGITLNYLYGMNSVYMNIDDINYNVQADSLWQIYIANVDYGHASADAGDNGAADALKKKGSGFSTSIGFQYYRNRNDAMYNPCFNGKAQKKYDYKVGFSLIDIGWINWKNSASRYEFNDVSTDWYGIDTLSIDGLSGADSTFNTQFYGLQQAGYAGNSFKIFTPAAASLQFDYAYSPNIYFNFSVIQRLPLGDIRLKRPNQISVAARYETKRFEISVPYSFYDYFRHRLGVAVRYGVLTIGTDMLGPYTGLFDAYGMDIYFGIKWQLSPSCDRKPSKGSRVKGAKGMGCFDDF